MATDRQIEANRRNAQNSTGPTTEEGKFASSRNALTHGLCAQSHLLDDERLEVYIIFQDNIIDELAPDSVYQEELVYRIANLLWRLRRIPVFETAILAWMAHRQVEVFDSPDSYNINPTPGITRYGEHKGLRESDNELPEWDRPRLQLGRLLEAEMRRDLIGKLGRYEAHLMRQLQKTYDELERSRG